MGKGKGAPLLPGAERRGWRKERREEAGALPRPGSRSTHIAFSSPTPALDPSNRSGAGGGVAKPSSPQRQPPAAGTAPPGPRRPPGDPPEPPKTSASPASLQTHPTACPSSCCQMFNSFLPRKTLNPLSLLGGSG